MSQQSLTDLLSEEGRGEEEEKGNTWKVRRGGSCPCAYTADSTWCTSFSKWQKRNKVKSRVNNSSQRERWNSTFSKQEIWFQTDCGGESDIHDMMLLSQQPHKIFFCYLHLFFMRLSLDTEAELYYATLQNIILWFFHLFFKPLQCSPNLLFILAAASYFNSTSRENYCKASADKMQQKMLTKITECGYQVHFSQQQHFNDEFISSLTHEKHFSSQLFHVQPHTAAVHTRGHNNTPCKSINETPRLPYSSIVDHTQKHHENHQ